MRFEFGSEFGFYNTKRDPVKPELNGVHFSIMARPRLQTQQGRSPRYVPRWVGVAFDGVHLKCE